MEENGFFDKRPDLGLVADLQATKVNRPLISLSADTTIQDAISSLKKHGISQAPVLDEGRLTGILTETKLLHRALKGEPSSDTIRDVADLDFCVVHPHSELDNLVELFRRFQVALVFNKDNHPVDIITRIDLIDYMSSKGGR